MVTMIRMQQEMYLLRCLLHNRSGSVPIQPLIADYVLPPGNAERLLGLSAM
jgi:hypothetical protein